MSDITRLYCFEFIRKSFNAILGSVNPKMLKPLFLSIYSIVATISASSSSSNMALVRLSMEIAENASICFHST